MSVKLEDHAAVLAKVKANPEQFAVAREGIAAAKAGKSIADCPNDANPLMAQIWRIGHASVTSAPLTAEEAQKARAAMAAPLAVIDIPAGHPQEAALVAFLRSKGYDANVCDSARVLWNGEPIVWDGDLYPKWQTLMTEFDALNDPAIIKLDGKAWSWSRDSSATRLQQRGVPEHIALAAITLAVLGGKAIVFGADGATITVERG